MKVCTDSCLFGAWTADWIIRNKKNTNTILDMGAGTGLLSLMLAQKLTAASIDAIEFEPLAVQQAKENFMQSPFTERLHLHNGRIQDFSPQYKYDVIICNPPFYEHDLRSESRAKNMAHHNAALTLPELISAVENLLSAKGSFAVLLPYHRTNEFEQSAHEAGLFLNKKTWVKQTPTHSYFRSLCLFSKEKMNAAQDEMIIRDEQENYTPEFADLLKDYYLYL